MRSAWALMFFTNDVRLKKEKCDSGKDQGL